MFKQPTQTVQMKTKNIILKRIKKSIYNYYDSDDDDDDDHHCGRFHETERQHF